MYILNTTFSNIYIVFKFYFRSVGPYSPAAGGPGSFHTSPFHTPTASNHFNPAELNSPATNENSTNYHPPTDFSVNSLVHPRSDAATIQGQPSPVAFTASDSSFSVSSLTSSYANDVAAKYATNPYASAYAASAAAGFGPGSFNSFMGAAAAGSMPTPPMTPMGAMSYYGQYSNTYAGAAGAAGAASAAAASFAPNPYYMPNPGYPYSHYGQYSQSPYF